MKKLITCLVFLMLQKVGHCEDLSFDLAINTDEKIMVGGMIHADPPIQVQVEMKHLRKSSDVNSYRIGIDFSRKPGPGELERLTLSVFPESILNDPIGHGVVFSETKWKDLNSKPWKVELKRGLVKLPVKFTPRERLMCRISSGGGYSALVVEFANDEGACSIRWEATSGESKIEIVKFDDYVESLRKHENPQWKKWKFTPVDNGDPEFIAIER